MMICQGLVPGALARRLAARGYRRLTAVQRAVLRAEPGADLLVSAPTGSGKTIAFGLALAPLLGGVAGPRALVVTPTRELAAQVRAELAWLYAGDARVGACVGGADPQAERAALAEGLDVVVGSPGRLRDHIGAGALRTAAVAAVVLDEADAMLDLGFRDDLEAILRALPEGRRTLMFSATVTPATEALARRVQRGALRLDLAAGASLALQAVAVAADDREAAIVNLLRLHDPRAAIVFCGRREAAGELAGRLGRRGFAVVALSGVLSQRRRNAALAAMREGRARVCVATDLAARGIDLPGLELVLHADLPASPELLLHRSGRTGRAGRPGLAVLIAPLGRRRRAEALIARAGVTADWIAPPDRAEVLARELERLLADPALGEPGPDEAGVASRLLAAHGPERVAAAFGRLWAAGRPAPAVLGLRPRRRVGTGFIPRRPA
jgi:ATP-dependent RNA helicase DeaD